MDIVNVEDEALRVSANAIKDLQESVAETVSECRAKLDVLSRGFTADDKFIGDIKNLISVLEDLGGKLSTFAEENLEALQDRFTKFNEYISKAYVRRNFG